MMFASLLIAMAQVDAEIDPPSVPSTVEVVPLIILRDMPPASWEEIRLFGLTPGGLAAVGLREMKWMRKGRWYHADGRGVTAYPTDDFDGDGVLEIVLMGGQFYSEEKGGEVMVLSGETGQVLGQLSPTNKNSTFGQMIPFPSCGVGGDPSNSDFLLTVETGDGNTLIEKIHLEFKGGTVRLERAVMARIPDSEFAGLTLTTDLLKVGGQVMVLQGLFILLGEEAGFRVVSFDLSKPEQKPHILSGRMGAEFIGSPRALLGIQIAENGTLVEVSFLAAGSGTYKIIRARRNGPAGMELEIVKLLPKLEAYIPGLLWGISSSTPSRSFRLRNAGSEWELKLIRWSKGWDHDR
jgi:hypothetical protein